MRIGLLAYGIEREPTGIRRYTIELACALARNIRTSNLRVLTFGKPIGKLEDVPIVRVPIPFGGLLPVYVVGGSSLIPSLAEKLKLDILHDPSGNAPFLFGAGKARSVATIHDTMPLLPAGSSTWLEKLIYHSWLPLVGPKVEAFVTVSETSRKDMIRLMGIPRQKVFVVYPGVGNIFRPTSRASAAPVLSMYGLADTQYILTVSSRGIRKNLPCLLQAFAQLRASDKTHCLVVVGPGSEAQKPRQMIRQLGLGTSVRLLGTVPDEHLAALYSGATLFVFASLYEGFGLPVLEAMACGTPVVCSNAGALPEVASGAAIMLNPQDSPGFCRAMEELLGDENLRQELALRGLRRSSQYSWERTVANLIQIYDMLLAEN